MRKFLIPAVLIAAALMAGAAQAASPLASDVVGQVVDADKHPIAGAVVILAHLETGRVQKARTNSRGRYHFANVRSDGTYQIQAMADIGHVRFAPGSLQLGQTMRRNFVLGAAPGCDTFPLSWRWSQSDLAEVISPIDPYTCPLLGVDR